MNTDFFKFSPNTWLIPKYYKFSAKHLSTRIPPVSDYGIVVGFGWVNRECTLVGRGGLAGVSLSRILYLPTLVPFVGLVAGLTVSVFFVANLEVLGAESAL